MIRRFFGRLFPLISLVPSCVIGTTVAVSCAAVPVLPVEDVVLGT